MTRSIGGCLRGATAASYVLLSPVIAVDPPPIEIFTGILQTLNAPNPRMVRVRMR